MSSTPRFNQPDDQPTPEQISQLLTLFNLQRYADARTSAELLTVKFPQHGFAWKALGSIYKKIGRPDQALLALTRAAALLPLDADVHYNLGNSLLEQEQCAPAAACYQQALALQPGYMAAHYNLGKAWQLLGDLGAAETSYRNALALQPDFAEASSSLGVVLDAQGRTAEALEPLRRAVQRNPHEPLHHTNLANALQKLGDNAAAETHYRLALQTHPDLWQPLYNLAHLLRDQKQFAEAQSLYVRVLQQRPEFAEGWFSLGNCLLAQQRYDEAELSFAHAVRIRPDYAEAHNHLGIALREQERLAEAEQSYRTALHLKPAYLEVLNNLGNVLREMDRIPEAEQSYQQALQIDPDYAEAYNNLGIALKSAGRLDEARDALERAIALNPEFLEPHYGIATLKTYSAADPHIDLLEKQLATVHELSAEAQIRFWFAIGKMYEDLERFDDSFAAYERGNQLKFSTLNWDNIKETEFLNRIKTTFSEAFFSRPEVRAQLDSRKASAARTPIFIVGMPRSGTSLLEQILSTHPGVFGAGELMTLNEVIVAAMPQADYQHYPQASADFTPDQWQGYGADYLDKVWALAPGSSHITDKMPSNFLHIGMIHLMFPNAKIIHAMRDPMDSCFSNYSRLFNKNNIAFSYDLEALGHYYNRYIDLMQHWHAVLPPGTVLDCRYEDMVRDTEAQARRVLAYIGLPWDERCLDFHKNRRRVKTASQAQVQRPIYQTSVARWKSYEIWLGPLIDVISRGKPYT